MVSYLTRLSSSKLVRVQCWYSWQGETAGCSWLYAARHWLRQHICAAESIVRWFWVVLGCLSEAGMNTWLLEEAVRARQAPAESGLAWSLYHLHCFLLIPSNSKQLLVLMDNLLSRNELYTTPLPGSLHFAVICQSCFEIWIVLQSLLIEKWADLTCMSSSKIEKYIFNTGGGKGKRNAGTPVGLKLFSKCIVPYCCGSANNPSDRSGANLNPTFTEVAEEWTFYCVWMSSPESNRDIQICFFHLRFLSKYLFMLNWSHMVLC